MSKKRKLEKQLTAKEVLRLVIPEVMALKKRIEVLEQLEKAKS